jgi:7-keto-8-aminopelargonate synthetase-like enzyme
LKVLNFANYNYLGYGYHPEVIAAANERGIAMVFTGRRHFRH